MNSSNFYFNTPITREEADEYLRGIQVSSRQNQEYPDNRWFQYTVEGFTDVNKLRTILLIEGLRVKSVTHSGLKWSNTYYDVYQ